MGDASETVVDLDAGDFQEGAVDRSRRVPVVVDFHAGGCGPCQTLGPILKEVVREQKGAVVLVRVDVDRNPELAQAYGVRGLPAVKALVDGQVVTQLNGSTSVPRLRAFVADLAATEPPG